MGKTINAPIIPAVGEGKRGVDGHLGYLLRQAHAAHRIRMEKALGELDVTLPQFSVLTMLAAYPGASGADLARLSLLTPQTMSVIVHNLERAGAVSRHPHPIHGRIQVIELTEPGRQLLDACRSRVQPVEAAMDSGLDEAGQQLVRAWLVRLAEGDGVL